MDVRRRALLLAFCAVASLTAAQAQNASVFRTINEALETDARGMSLPAAQEGVMTVTTCTTCPVKVLRSTTATVYTLRDKPVSFAEFRNTLSIHSDAFVTVKYSVKTKELVTVNASVDPIAGGKR